MVKLIAIACDISIAVCVLIALLIAKEGIIVVDFNRYGEHWAEIVLVSGVIIVNIWYLIKGIKGEWR
jgi:hypothetical protein|tara:strand:- start:33122 stop:33322 length:201 start_codon:yes stop_codon:yes gene_type:complete